MPRTVVRAARATRRLQQRGDVAQGGIAGNIFARSP